MQPHLRSKKWKYSNNNNSHFIYMPVYLQASCSMGLQAVYILEHQLSQADPHCWKVVSSKDPIKCFTI